MKYNNILEQLINADSLNKVKSRALLEVKCAFCDKIHLYPKNQILAKIKNNELRFCSQKCQGKASKTGEIRKCMNCSKEIYRTPKEILRLKHGYSFCSRNCSSIYMNKYIIDNNKTEEQKLSISNKLKLYYLKNPKPKIDKKHNCIICNKIIDGLRKTCSNRCYKIKLKEIGKMGGVANSNSPFTKRNRSKNERLFFDKIKQIFPDAINNKRIFNGYDADVIIPSLKVAIHWNGNWHYKQIFSKKHFHSIKIKDKKRYKEIENAGYSNYIIKDTGKPSENKVNNEIDKFILFSYNYDI